MPTPDGRVSPGDNIFAAMSARHVNSAVDAREGAEARATSVTAISSPQPNASNCRLLAKNNGASLLPMFGAAKITGIVGAPGPAATKAVNSQFRRSPTLAITTATAASPTDSVAVTLEPIKPGRVGWVAVAGIVQCVASVTDAAHTRLALAASSSQFASGTSGQLELLWKEGVGSGKLALARFSASAAGSSVKVSTTTADWGKGSSQSFTFSGETITAYNYRSKVLSGKWVAIAKADDGLYYLIDCEMDQQSVVWDAAIVSTTSGGVTSSKLRFSRKKVWVVSVEEDTPIDLGLAECVPTYTGG